MKEWTEKERIKFYQNCDTKVVNIMSKMQEPLKEEIINILNIL